MKLKSYKELLVWQKSMTLVRQVYSLTRTLPSSEQFGLASQMQRAVVGIPSNLAEGYGRQHRKEFIQFISIAQVSTCELETQLLICKDVYHGTEAQIDDILGMLEEVL